jgi:hypothetical protein
MLLSELLEGYDKNHKCQTPGTIYKTSFHDDHIKIRLNLPKSVKDVEIKDYDDLEADLHYAIEKVLKKYYFSKK